MKRFNKIYIEISNICNLSCSFCHGTGRPKTSMSPENFAVVLDKIKPYTDFIYYHLLGEPLLHGDLPAMLDMAYEGGFKSCITTNGSLLKSRGALLSDFIDRTEGGDRGCGLHKISISLQAQEANGGLLPLEEYIEECCRFAKALEGRTIVVFRFWNEGGLSSNNPFMLDKLREYYKGEWKSHPLGMKIGSKTFIEFDSLFKWPDLTEEEPDYEQKDPGKNRFFCYGLKDQLGILADGTVVPCCLDAEGDLALGNIFREDLSDILSSQRALSICDGFRQGKALEELCRKCGYARRFV